MSWTIHPNCDYDDCCGADVKDEQGRTVARVYGWDGISPDEAVKNAQRIVDAVNERKEEDR